MPEPSTMRPSRINRSYVIGFVSFPWCGTPLVLIDRNCSVARQGRIPCEWKGSGRQTMRVGLFYQIQAPKPWTATSESQRIYEALEQIPFAERQGFESVWFSEHHFRPVWSHNSAPDLTLAAVSQRTSRIRL